jgi:hypothetical protein
MQLVRVCLLAFVTVLLASSVRAQDYDKGTGQQGCYFGDCPNDPDPSPEPQPQPSPDPAPLPQTSWTDICNIGNEIVKIGIDNQTYGGFGNTMINGFRRPPQSPFCIYDIVATFTGAQMCVLNNQSGAVYWGGPPQFGGVWVGNCRPCNGFC